MRGKEFGGKCFCGLHMKAAKQDTENKMFEIEKLMWELGITKDEVREEWELPERQAATEIMAAAEAAREERERAAAAARAAAHALHLEAWAAVEHDLD